MSKKDNNDDEYLKERTGIVHKHEIETTNDRQNDEREREEKGIHEILIN